MLPTLSFELYKTFHFSDTVVENLLSCHVCKGWEINSATTLASKPASGHSFYITIVILSLS